MVDFGESDKMIRISGEKKKKKKKKKSNKNFLKNFCEEVLP